MKRAPKLLRILALILTLTMLLAACNTPATPGSTPGEPTPAQQTEPPVTSPEPGEGTEEPSGGGLYEGADDTFEVPYDEWSDMTSDELYQMALQEPSEPIIVYSSSSKWNNVAETFPQDYPGLTIQVEDMDTGDIIPKFEIEKGAGARTADMLFLKDGTGEINIDFWPYGYLEHFYPRDICEHFDTAYLEYGFPLYCGATMMYYSVNMFPDGAPISSWWDLLDEDVNLLMKNPSEDETMLVVFCTMVNNADKMAEGYKAKYGKDIEYTYDASVGFGVTKEAVVPNNAGYEFVYRLSQKEKLTFIDDGDEIVASVQQSTMKTIGVCSAGKMKNSTEEAPVSWILEMDPFLTVPGINYMYVVAGTKHPAGVRLLMRYASGDLGGDNMSEGFKPFTGMGNWSLRDDIPDTKNPVAIGDTNSLPANVKQVNPIYQVTREFWDYWLSK